MFEQRKSVSPEAIRNKLIHMAEMKAGEKVDTSRMSEKEQDVIEKLKLMEFGTWFEHRDGKREKVAWCNPSTLHFLFVDQSGKRSGMRTGEELALAMVAGEMRIISGARTSSPLRGGAFSECVISFSWLTRRRRAFAISNGLMSCATESISAAMT